MKSFFKGNYLKCPLSLNIKFIFNIFFMVFVFFIIGKLFITQDVNFTEINLILIKRIILIYLITSIILNIILSFKFGRIDYFNKYNFLLELYIFIIGLFILINKDALILLCMNFFPPVSYIFIIIQPYETLNIIFILSFLSFLWVYTFIIIPTCIYKFIKFFWVYYQKPQ